MADHPVRDEDLTMNPMAGYKPATPSKHCKTMMMPAFNPDQHPQLQSSPPLAPTEEMQATPPALTLKNVIRELIEANVDSWKALPAQLQELMLSNPEKFRFYRSSKSVDIIFNGMRFYYEASVNAWCLKGLVEQ